MEACLDIFISEEANKKHAEVFALQKVHEEARGMLGIHTATFFITFSYRGNVLSFLLNHCV